MPQTEIVSALTSELRFDLDEEMDGTHLVVPIVDGTRLEDLVERYELLRGLSPAGGYGGIVAEHCPSGTLPDYFRGQRRSFAEARRVPRWDRRLRPRRLRGRDPRIEVLACGSCGEGGCWPGSVTVSLGETDVVWSGFGNSHRPEWDYSGLGPSYFSRRQYEDALDQLGAVVDRLGTGRQ